MGTLGATVGAIVGLIFSVLFLGMPTGIGGALTLSERVITASQGFGDAFLLWWVIAFVAMIVCGIIGHAVESYVKNSY